MKRTHGFSLIEVFVAMLLASLVMTAAATLLMAAVKTRQDARARAQMNRDLTHAMERIVFDLSHAGVGVPYGLEADEDGVIKAQPPAAQLRPPIRVGGTDSIGFLGDLPFPNSDLNGIAIPGVFDKTNSHRVGIVSELSTCTPPIALPNGGENYECNTVESNILGLGGAPCTNANRNAPTCPWGLNKMQPNTDLVFSASDGKWFKRRWGGAFDTRRGRVMLHLAHTAERDLPSDQFIVPGTGGGFLSNIDRVFYTRTERDGSYPCASTDCVIHRRQCWELPAADSAGFPQLGLANVNLGTALAGCDPTAGEGTPWEAIATNIETLQFRYFTSSDSNEQGAPLNAGRSSLTRVVQITITSRVDINNKTLTETMQRRVFLPHPGGIIDNPPIALNQGGCADLAATGGIVNMCAPE